MKKPVVHYSTWPKNKNSTILIVVCGTFSEMSTDNKRKVTCLNCKRTKIYRKKT